MKIGFRERRRGIIETILVAKRAEVARMSATAPLLPSRSPAGGVAEALARKAGEPLRVVAEIGSGKSRAEEDPGALAIACANLGVAAIVVHTFAPLARCRDALDEALGSRRPRLLCADFFLDPIQIDRAEDAGADGVILIARIVSRAMLARLVDVARARGLTPIVDVATAAEVADARSIGAAILGVSGRDLRTMRADREVAMSLLPQIDHEAVAVLLAGIATLADLAAVADGRAEAALIAAETLVEGRR